MVEVGLGTGLPNGVEVGLGTGLPGGATTAPPPKKMVKVGGLGGGLLMVPCYGFYVHLKSVFPLIRF